MEIVKDWEVSVPDMKRRIDKCVEPYRPLLTRAKSELTAIREKKIVQKRQPHGL